MPPQAYTKEVLASAFDWLSRQPDHVKKSIRTSEDLVGIFLKTTRLKEGSTYNQSSSQATASDLASTKSFRNELQGLALNLKQFEDRPAQASQPEESTQHSSEYLHELSLMMKSQNDSQPTNNNTAPTDMRNEIVREKPPASNPSPSMNKLENSELNLDHPENANTVFLKLDKKTISAIEIAKDRLNLSSNTEAIRVLVSLGEKHLRKVFGAE